MTLPHQVEAQRLAEQMRGQGDMPEPMFDVGDGFDVDLAGLFEGYGGLTMAAQSVLAGELGWYSEIEPAACKVLERHHPGVPNLGDVTQVDWASAPRPRVLTGGFPCQDISSAGRQAGIRPGTRSGLWSHMAYAISQLRPELVVIENVRGLLTARGAEPTDELLAAEAARDKVKGVMQLIDSKLARALREGNVEYVHRHRRDRLRFVGRLRAAVAAVKRSDAQIVRAIGTVLGSLADLGYDARWVGLRAADVGAPHSRYRIFITAWPRAHSHPARIGRGEGRPESEGLVGRPDAPVGGDAVQDADRTARCEWRIAAPGQAEVRRSRAAAGGRGEVLAPDAEDDRLAQLQPSGHGAERAGAAGDHKTPADPHGISPLPSVPGTARPEQEGASAIDWGAYGPAIARWELILGRPAPAPTMTGARGGQQLSPAFVEWMQGLPAGYVTAVPGISRNEQLKMLGNGVVPQQAAVALQWLLATTRAVVA